jgi:hypothetical protein
MRLLLLIAGAFAAIVGIPSTGSKRSVKFC